MKCLDNCGKCCVRIQIPAEILEKHKDKIENNRGNVCVFLGEDKRCRIYEDRPEICRQFGENPLVPCLLVKEPKTNSVKLNQQIGALRRDIFK